MYEFKCSSATHRVGLSVADSAVLASANCAVYPAWRAGIFASKASDEVVMLSRAEALQDAWAMLNRLEADRALLPYAYTLQLAPPGSRHAREVKDFKLSSAGRPASASARPGFASVDWYWYEDIDGAAADALVRSGKMRPQEAESFHKWTTNVRMSELIHDLRDMKPFVTDDGYTIQATRKARPTDLLSIVREIVEFIEENPCELVEVAFLGGAPWE